MRLRLLKLLYLYFVIRIKKSEDRLYDKSDFWDDKRWLWAGFKGDFKSDFWEDKK